MDEKRHLWQELIKDYRASQLSAKDWCQQNQVKISTLRYWVTKLNKENQPTSVNTEWLPVKVPGSDFKDFTEETSCRIQVNIGRASIKVSPGFDPQVFEAVVRILSEQC